MPPVTRSAIRRSASMPAASSDSATPRRRPTKTRRSAGRRTSATRKPAARVPRAAKSARKETKESPKEKSKWILQVELMSGQKTKTIKVPVEVEGRNPKLLNAKLVKSGASRQKPENVSSRSAGRRRRRNSSQSLSDDDTEAD